MLDGSPDAGASSGMLVGVRESAGIGILAHGDLPEPAQAHIRLRWPESALKTNQETPWLPHFASGGTSGFKEKRHETA